MPNWIKRWLRVLNAATVGEPLELLIYGDIGDDWLSDRGTYAAEFNEAIKGSDKSRELHVHIHSQGGNVWDAFAIAQMIQNRGNVTTFVDGIAASSASVIFQAGAKRVMPRQSMQMIHRTSAAGYGNAEEHERSAVKLRAHDDTVCAFYAKRTGLKESDIADMMAAETWMDGEACKERGFCDELTDEAPIKNQILDISNFRNAPASLVDKKQSSNAVQARGKKGEVMDRLEMIAWLREQGETVEDSISDTDLKNKFKAFAKGLKKEPENKTRDNVDASLAAEFKEMREDRKREKAARVEARVKELQPNRIPVAQVKNWVARAMLDETVLDDLAHIEPRNVGAEPVGGAIECTGESLKDVQAYILSNGPELTRKFLGVNSARTVDKEVRNEIKEGSIRVANAIKKHRKMLTDVLNANTIDSALQRTIILTDVMLRAYKIPLLPLRKFSTVFSNVPLEGSDTVTVPYFPLQGQGESKSFKASDGYTMTGTTNQQQRQIPVGGDGDLTKSGGNATAGTARDRKYQDISFTSYERNRQPYLNLEQMFGMKAEQLAVDIFSDIIRGVVVAANYATALTKSAAAFTSDDLATLWEVGTTAKWPQNGRSLALSHFYQTSLIKDPAFKFVYASGSDETLRDAAIKRAYGFGALDFVPSLDTYFGATNGAGWITHMSALLVATAPIMPTEEVRLLLSRYEVVTDPETGITFEYRRWGSPDMDQTREVVECSYGAAKGVESALQIIKKQ